MEIKNKKIIFTVISVVALALIIILILFLSGNNKKELVSEEIIGSIATEEDSYFYQPKPIPLEWMASEEKESFNLRSGDDNRLQVLSRDEDGNISAYKIIYTDEDILSAY